MALFQSKCDHSNRFSKCHTIKDSIIKTKLRNLLLASAGIAPLALTALPVRAQTAPPSAPPAKKNVLFIVADDLNTDLGSYGHPMVQTPNIDRIAAMGTRFDRAYCQFPHCGPSRASLLSGLRPDTTGLYSNQSNVSQLYPQVVTLPRLFHQNGYYTARSGKIFHQGVGPPWLGVDGPDDKEAWDERLNPNWTARGREGKHINLNPGGHGGSALDTLESLGDDEDHPDGQTAKFIVQKLKDRALDKKPFFLAAGFYMPHVPLWAPSKYFAPYPLEKITLATNASRAGKPPAAFSQDPDFGLNTEQQKQAQRAYYASTSFMDAQVGKLMDELKRSGLDKNTLVVFWGDHGFHLGSQQMWGKQTLFEDSARAPLIIYDPSQKAPRAVVTSPVEFVDVYPTLIDLCDVPRPPQALAGLSLRPLLDDPATLFKNAAYTQVGRAATETSPEFMGRSVRTPRYRYTEWDGARQGVELYDYQTDPLETRNLAGDPASAPIIAQLQPMLRRILPVEATKIAPATKKTASNSE